MACPARRHIRRTALIYAQVPSNASFETHRGRPLGHAFQCKRILDAVPGLRLTADPSHWHVVHERFLDMDAVAGRVDHVHARVGNEERPQLAAPFDDASPRAAGAEGRSPRWWDMFRWPATDWHVAFWRKCWDAGARTACVEYGPAPYQLVGDYRDLWLQNCAAKEHLEKSFAAWERNSFLSSESRAEWEREQFGELP